MATRRISKSAVDWKRFQSLIPQSEQPSLNLLLGKSFQYVSRVTTLPDSLPKIDFESYRKQVPEKAAIVEKLQTGYSSIQVPYPKDAENLIAKINDQEKEQDAHIRAHLKSLEKVSADLKKQREVITSLPPLEEMTVELAEYYFPQKEQSALELFGEDPHSKMLEDKKKAKQLGHKGHH